MNNSKMSFYLTIGFELILYPFLWIKSQLCMRQIKKHKPIRHRNDIENSRILVAVHEWGGYNMVRQKTLKNGTTFTCGLKYQLDRFSTQKNLDLIVTMSDHEKHKNLNYVSSNAKVILVSNIGMDFSGYEAVYNQYKNEPNRYIILCNSSVNAIQDTFLDRYIEYMNQNKDVGMLGVSYCTNLVQSLIQPNFTPHLQSFFLLTTVNVLEEIVSRNGRKFPGSGIRYKRKLIRDGEVLISQIAMRLGYNIAVVDPESGMPYKFESFKDWKLRFGDIRQYISDPNRITPICNC